MNTFILFWNPRISSYTLERLRDDLEHWTYVSNWSVWQHEDARYGDRFFMVRCGEGKTGICMSGRFNSSPYKGEDWSGKGREVYYMDLKADVVIDPDYLPILTTEKLKKHIRSFDWSGGHSGRLLKAAQAKKLEMLWSEFLEQNEWIFGKHSLRIGFDDYPSKDERNFLIKQGGDLDAEGMGIRYYELGMRLLKKYQYDRANAYFRVAYDMLQEHKTTDCYPDLCYRIYRGLKPYTSTFDKIPLLEEALEGFYRQASLGKDVPEKTVKDIEGSLKFWRYQQSENTCKDVVSPDAASRVKGLELIDEFMEFDYTNECQFHDAVVDELRWIRDEVVLRINIDNECIATFRFVDTVNFDGELELPYLNEMKFRMFNNFVECSLDGVGATITCKEVVCEKVEKYEEFNPTNAKSTC